MRPPVAGSGTAEEATVTPVTVAFTSKKTETGEEKFENVKCAFDAVPIKAPRFVGDEAEVQGEVAGVSGLSH